jgi:hypothetical protein
MAEEASFHDVDLDPIEDKLVKFNPVATILRNALYVSWPVVIPNAVIFAIVTLILLINLLGGDINRPLLLLFFIFFGISALLAVDVALAWMVSRLKSELLAVTALGFVAVFAVYMIFITMTGPATYRFSPFYLLAVSPLYTVTFLITIALVAWFIYSVASGILAARQIPERNRIIARPDYFESRLALETLERYGGLPPVIQFLPNRTKLKWIYYASALLFLVGFNGLQQAAGSYYTQYIALNSACGSASNLDACLRASSAFYQIGVVFVALTVMAVALWGANRLITLMRQQSTHSLAEMQKIDARPPVLFLRAFRDDQIPLAEPKRTLFGRLVDLGRPHTNLDLLLLELGTPYGPVVALGNPTDSLPPYGAARGYFDHKTWQDSVRQLAAESTVIVICLDDTEGIWWEVTHLAEQGRLNKTLFVVHPKDAKDGARVILGRLIDRLQGHITAERVNELTLAAQRLPCIIGLYFKDDGSLAIARSSTLSRLAFTLVFRWFLRLRLGLEPRRLKEAVEAAQARASGLPVVRKPSAVTAIVWLACALILVPVLMFVFVSWRISFVPLPNAGDGQMFSGAVLGCALFGGVGWLLSRRERWQGGNGHVGIYWIGWAGVTAATVICPVFGMMRLVSDGVSCLIAIVFFAVNCVAFIYSRRSRRPTV